jgi:hypothetical protein
MSLTKVELSPAEIKALVVGVFGTDATVASARAADAGMYNAAYNLELTGGGPRRAALKAPPPQGLRRRNGIR